MRTATDIVERRARAADASAPARHRPAALALAALGLALVTATMVANAVAAGDLDAAVLAWSFGLTTTGFAIAKLAIAVTLVGILYRLWTRVESVKAVLPALRPESEPEAAEPQGPIATPYGPSDATRQAPPPLLVHRVARAAWAPMLTMGAMLVAAGLVLSVFQASTASASTFATLAAWVQGVQFLGEAMILAGISFLLGSILAALRAGGGEVQQSLGLTVKTLRMPLSAKLFLALMGAGMVVAMAQLVLYLVAAYGVADPVAWYAWLGPFRELGLGLLLAGIVLALYTIGTVLGFQFARIREIVAAGR
jgi:hypothetical protein